MKKEGYTINETYQGGYSSLEPGYGVFTGYRSSAGGFGMTTDPRNANILQEVSSKLASGVKAIEVTAVSPEIFESMPQQHLKEVNRLAKLTGVDITVHGPIVEPSGMTREGITEVSREAAERQMIQAVERSHEMNPEGNFPVTFHSSALLPAEMKAKGEKQVSEIFVINTETGGLDKLPLKERKFPGEETTPEKEIARRNEQSWSQSLTNLGYSTEKANELISGSGFLALMKKQEEKAGKEITPPEKQAEHVFNIGKNYLNDSYRQLKDLYDIAHNKAVEGGNKKEQHLLEKLGEKIKSKVEKINKDSMNSENLVFMQEIISDGLDTLSGISPPKIFRPLQEFTKEKTTTTFANVALASYKKFKDKAPIISIENPPAGGAFATGEELKQIVEESRKKFVEKAVEQGKMSKSEAQKQAEKLLGVTWDVGHINMLRKHGYESEDIIKETEKVAPLIKHIHLSDNFGFEHTELPMGMGNVPIKEIMEKIGKKAGDVKKIIEAANWWQHFKTPPFQENLEAFGSSIYYMDMAPYWNQTTGFQQGYLGGYGQMLPQVHYETFGAGFSQLPAELGGQVPGAGGGRMSGRPME